MAAQPTVTSLIQSIFVLGVKPQPITCDKTYMHLTPLPGNKIFEIFSHMCNTCNTDPEKAVTALGRVISGYTAT